MFVIEHLRLGDDAKVSDCTIPALQSSPAPTAIVTAL